MKLTRILLTGASGMVGKNICEHPAAQLYDILAPSRKELDLLDYKSVDKYFEIYKPEMVIHCAGVVGGIQANIREPVRFLMANLDMGRNVVLSAKKYGIERLINLGSSCMYPRDEINPLKEESVLKGELEPTNEGYAIAKIVTAKLCEYITHEGIGFQYKTLIPCNLYGRFDKFDPKNSHMVPAIIDKLYQAKLNNSPVIEIWGNGTARREFMYAGDFADCIWRCVERFESLPHVTNVGLGEDWSVNEYYKCAANVVGYEGEFTHDLSKPVGMKQKLVDSTLLNEWGWRPMSTLEEGLQKTLKFYLERK